MIITITQKEIIEKFKNNGFESFKTIASGDYQNCEVLTFYSHYKADENYIVVVKKQWESGPQYYLKSIVKNKLIYYTTGLETDNAVKTCIERALFMFNDQLNIIKEKEREKREWISAN